MLALATSLGAAAREGGGQREQTSQLPTEGEVEVRQPEWGRWATESSLMMMLSVVVVMAGHERQKLEQERVLGGSLGPQRSSQQQQQLVVLEKTPCAAASGAQETDQQRLFFPLDPWASSAVVEKMSRPPRQKTFQR